MAAPKARGGCFLLERKGGMWYIQKRKGKGSMILWLNGAFGVGKTTVARQCPARFYLTQRK